MLPFVLFFLFAIATIDAVDYDDGVGGHDKKGSHRVGGGGDGTIDICEKDWNNVPASELPICVIGGGLSGLTVATELQEAGKFVILFEQNYDHIGGKLDTEITWDSVWEKGPVLFSGGEPYIKKTVKKYGLNMTRWRGDNVGLFNPVLAYVSTINASMLNNLRKEWTDLGEVYTQQRSKYPSWLWEPRGFEKLDLLEGNVTELYYSTQDWLDVFGISGLAWPFGIIFTCEGYGHIDDLPALYMLKLLTPEVLYDLLQLITGHGEEEIDIYTVWEGFKELAYRMTKSLQCVYMAHEVAWIYRVPTIGRVFTDFKVGMGTTTREVHCSKVVLAFPPLLSKLERIIGQFSLEEKRLFGKVKVHRYFSSGHLLQLEGNKNVYLGTTGLDDNTYLEGDGYPIALVRSGKGWNPDAYTIYSWIYGRFDSGPTVEEFGMVDDILRNFLRLINQKPPAVSFLEGYEFFPHVSKEDIYYGFFQNFARLQGMGGIYYASTALSFESVNHAIENAEAVAALILSDTA